MRGGGVFPHINKTLIYNISNYFNSRSIYIFTLYILGLNKDPFSPAGPQIRSLNNRCMGLQSCLCLHKEILKKQLLQVMLLIINTKLVVNPKSPREENQCIGLSMDATMINKSGNNVGRESVATPKVRLRALWSHLESLVSLGMVTVLMLDTCGGGTWHMLHGHGIPVPTPQCWKLLPSGPAPAAGALRSP